MNFDKEIENYLNYILYTYKNNPPNIIQYNFFSKIINNIKLDYEKHNDDLCCLCLDILGNKFITLGCNHSYHLICIFKLLSTFNICPLCRRNIKYIIPNKNKDLLGFIACLKINIDFIDYSLNNIIKKEDSCKYAEINYNGIIKIIEKFKIKTGYDIIFMEEYVKTLNIYKINNF